MITQREAEIMDLADEISRQADTIARMVHEHVDIFDAVHELVGRVEVLRHWTLDPR